MCECLQKAKPQQQMKKQHHVAIAAARKQLRQLVLFLSKLLSLSGDLITMREEGAGLTQE